MTVIDVSLLHTVTGGTDVFSGRFTATPWAGGRPYTTVSGADITVPTPVVVQIVDGDPVEAIDLLVSGAEFCWKLAVTPKGSASSLIRYVAVPSSGPVAFGDLVDVDPLTFQPAEVDAPNWQELVAARLESAANLDDLPDASAARDNLELGSAAQSAATDFATAEQGAKADVAADEIAGRLSASGLSATFIAKPTRTQTVPVPFVTTYAGDSGGRYPAWLSKSRTRLFANARDVLRYSDNDTNTWVDAYTFTDYIDAVRDLDNGEVLVTTSPTNRTLGPGRVFVSTGFATNPATATWTETLTAHANGVYFTNSWSIDVYQNIILINDYGPKAGGAGNARYCNMSLDYGRTWTRIYDLGTAVGAHLHGVCYDPYWDRIWLTYGDDTNAILYNDTLGAGTWRVAQSSSEINGPYQSVGIIALPNCILFASDGVPNGINRIDRAQGKKTAAPFAYALETAHEVDTAPSLSTLCYGIFRAHRPGQDSPVLFAFAPETTTGRSKVIATKDGYTFHELWRDSADTTSRGALVALGPTARGNMIIMSNDGRTATFTRYQGPMPFGY